MTMCSECKRWKPPSEVEEGWQAQAYRLGQCMAAVDVSDDAPEKTKRDGLQVAVADHEGYAAKLLTAPTFSCALFEVGEYEERPYPEIEQTPMVPKAPCDFEAYRGKTGTPWTICRKCHKDVMEHIGRIGDFMAMYEPNAVELLEVAVGHRIDRQAAMPGEPWVGVDANTPSGVVHGRKCSSCGARVPAGYSHEHDGGGFTVVDGGQIAGKGVPE